MDVFEGFAFSDASGSVDGAEINGTAPVLVSDHHRKFSNNSNSGINPTKHIHKEHTIIQSEMTDGKERSITMRNQSFG